MSSDSDVFFEDLNYPKRERLAGFFVASTRSDYTRTHSTAVDRERE